MTVSDDDLRQQLREVVYGGDGVEQHSQPSTRWEARYVSHLMSESVSRQEAMEAAMGRLMEHGRRTALVAGEEMQVTKSPRSACGQAD